jgi:arylsulfatase A-like enzyme/Flp pilus assembly protein TadD
MGKRKRSPPKPPLTDATDDAPRIPRRPRGTWVLAGALTVLALGAFVFWKRPTRPRPVAQDSGLSVLLISIDTLRADAVGAYGRADAGTPWIDRLAAGGVRFARAHAHNVVTLPSHANILSGQLAFTHGIRDNSGFRFPADTATLATILKARGYRTGAFVSAFPLDSRFGLDVGFESYDDRLGGAETRTGFHVPERSGKQTVDAAVQWLAAQGSARTFALVHLYEPHFPYQPQEPWASRFPREPYQAEVAAADGALEPLLRPILEGGAAGRTLVVVTSDHGEALGSHGEATHGIFAYESTLRVPLIFYAPRVFGPAVVEAAVRHVDVLPTVLELLGADATTALAGRSLVPAFSGHTAPVPATYFESLTASLNQGWAPLHGVIADGLKFIDLPIPELYDLQADPAEAHNLAAARTGDLDRLRAVLVAFRKQEAPVTRRPEDAATLERLRALGYTAGGGPTAVKDHYSEEDDPKRLIALDAQESEVLRLYYAGDLEGALARCRDNIRGRPDMPAAYLQLAFLERARGDLDAAVLALRRAVTLRPHDAESVALLGSYLNEAGRSREAASLLEPLVRSPQADIDVLTAYGMALAALGRHQDALAPFAAARAADPSNAMALVNTGTVYLMSGDAAQARRWFEDALRIDPDLARAHNSLGVVAAREGRQDDAVERWKHAARLDPTDYQTLFNLGATLRKLGRTQEARAYLEAYLREAPAATEGKDMSEVRAWLAGAAPSGGAR